MVLCKAIVCAVCPINQYVHSLHIIAYSDDYSHQRWAKKYLYTKDEDTFTFSVSKFYLDAFLLKSSVHIIFECK